MNEIFDIFISYRRIGGNTAKQLYHWLADNEGYSTFFDVQSLREGRWKEVTLGTGTCHTGFVCIGMQKLDMAITYMSEALEIYKKTLGEEHEQCVSLKDYLSQMKSELRQESHE